MQTRGGNLWRVISLLPPLREFWELSSGLQSQAASAFTCWAISPAPNLFLEFTYRVLTLGVNLAQTIPESFRQMSELETHSEVKSDGFNLVISTSELGQSINGTFTTL